MSAALTEDHAVGVVGAGAMGAGIAQVAALAGHAVHLYDTRAGAAEAAIAGIRRQLQTLLQKNKVTASQVDRAISGLQPASDLDAFAPCAMVVEAIVEDLQAKRQLFLELEKRMASDAILATNTSSISITAIGAALAHPERLVGMHFFNPAPVMPLVEVIAGALTGSAVADRVFATAERWKKTPVHARSTPAFIVNRVARPYYAEGLRLLQEQVADVATLDAVMRDAGGFRMGPFELMDLIGHDVNYAVTRSVFDSYYGDPRFTPSVVQLELINAGLLGRKSGRGFYDYREQAVPLRASEAEQVPPPADIRIHTDTPLGAALAARLSRRGVRATEMPQASSDGRVADAQGAALYPTDGRSATRRAAESGLAATVVVDLMLDAQVATRAAVAAAEQCGEASRASIAGLLQAAGFRVSVLRDSPGLAVMRTVAMLANEAADAVHQGVCSARAVDIAMRGGVNYPLGPMEWAQRIGASRVLQTLDHLAQHYGEPRYRASALLRQRAWSGRSLFDE